MKDELQKQEPAFCPDCEEKSVDNCEVSDKLKEMIAKRAELKEPEARDALIAMPKYKCKKVVWALKIKDIVFDSDLARQSERETDGSAMIIPEEEGYAPFKVDYEYVHKHEPQIGGYYVVYKDGYKSFSPASAFEEGYVRCSD